MMKPPSQPSSQHRSEQAPATPDWELLVGCLPACWEEQARALKAFTRARKVRSPGDLLRLVLTHVGVGLSLQRTAEAAECACLAKMSKISVWERIQSVGPWLEWMVRAMLRERMTCSQFAGYRPRVIDGTTVSGPHQRTRVRLHYSVSLTHLSCTELVTTDDRQAESFSHFSVAPDDLLIGDRFYAKARGIAAVKRAGGEAVVRLGRTSLTLYDAQGAKLDWLDWCRQLPPSGKAQRFAQFRDEDGAWVTGRVCALRLSPERADNARRRCLKKARRKGIRTRPKTLEAAGYLCLFTTAPKERLSLDLVIELYRARWQVELSFKRLKSLLDADHLREVTPQSALIWLQGKMLYALLLQACLEQAGAFSPR